MDWRRLEFLLKKYHNKYTNDTDIGYVLHKVDLTEWHSCINIKYNDGTLEKPSSIFVFQTGSVNITGAKNFITIKKSYEYIKKILNKYHDYIKIIKLDPDEVKKEIAKLIGRENVVNFTINERKKYRKKIYKTRSILDYMK